MVTRGQQDTIHLERFTCDGNGTSSRVCQWVDHQTKMARVSEKNGAGRDELQGPFTVLIMKALLSLLLLVLTP